MGSNVEAPTTRYLKDESSEPFIQPYFISDGKAPTGNGYQFHPPQKRQQHATAPPPRSWVQSLTCSYADKRCCCCKCSWKCCGISTLVIIVLIGLVIGGGVLYIRSRLTGTASSEDKDLWEQRLRQDDESDNLSTTNGKLAKSIMDGDFLLVSYDENYPEYLAALGIPGFVISLILSSREVITFRQPDDPKGNWTIKTKSDLMEQNALLRIGEPFTMEVNMGTQKGIMVSNCTLSGPADNILTCDIEEIVKKVKSKSVSVYTKAGFINTRTLIAKNISTKKYYQRISKLEIDNSNGNVEEESQISDDVNELNSRILKATESPKVQEKLFSDDNDDDWDDDFFDEDRN